MRYTCPAECAGVSHAGALLPKTEAGTVEAAPEAATALAPHGLVPVGDARDAAHGTGRVEAKRRTDDRRMLR